MIIELTNSELMVAVVSGGMRVVRKFQRGDQDRAGYTGGRWQTDIEAHAAELAFAKWQGLYPRGMSQSNIEDVDGWEVRHTEHPKGRLILRRNDNPEARFVLVRGSYGRYEIVGWILAKDGMVDEYLDAPGGRPPCWMVPADRLQAFS